LEGRSGSGEGPAALLSQVTRSFHSLSFLPVPFKHFEITPPAKSLEDYINQSPALLQKLWSPHCFRERGAPSHILRK